MSAVLHEGAAEGRALVLDEPLSFWGGLDPRTGEIVDRHHPQAGERVSGRILVMPSGRGSSSSSSTLAESLRAGTGPAGVILAVADGIVALGALVAADLYGRVCPVVVARPEAYAELETGAVIRILPDGRISPGSPGRPDARR